MSRGVLMYAHNNPSIDYLKISCANALMIQKNLGVPITLVTDKGSYEWGANSLGQALLDKCFEHVIFVKKDHTFTNSRNFSDTTANTQSLQFYNANHWEAYSLSPYDETLFIDVDYFIMSNALANCWDSKNDIMISSKIYSPTNTGEVTEKFIDTFGIKLFWATVIYFRKSDIAETVFSKVKHIQANYSYYRDLYIFENGMYRNDNAFSIAIHELNGFTQTMLAGVNELPIAGLLMSWDCDDIYTVNGINDITLYADTKLQTPNKYILVNIKNTDVHIMNKWAASRNAEQLIELYS